MSVMVLLLEFVRWDIGNKKAPENEGLVRSLHAVSGRVRSTQSLRGGRAAHSCFGSGIFADVHHGHHYVSVSSPYQVGVEKLGVRSALPVTHRREERQAARASVRPVAAGTA